MKKEGSEGGKEGKIKIHISIVILIFFGSNQKLLHVVPGYSQQMYSVSSAL